MNNRVEHLRGYGRKRDGQFETLGGPFIVRTALSGLGQCHVDHFGEVAHTPKRSAEPDHVGGALVASRASGHDYFLLPGWRITSSPKRVKPRALAAALAHSRAFPSDLNVRGLDVDMGLLVKLNLS